MDGIQFEEPIPHLFSFNNPYGACPECGGTGVVEGFSVDKIIPDKSKSVYGGAVSIWNSESLEPHKRRFINKSAALGFPIHRPIHELTQEQFCSYGKEIMKRMFLAYWIPEWIEEKQLLPQSPDGCQNFR